MNGKHDSFVHAAVNLGQLMAFVLIDDKKIARRDAVKAVVDQKLLSAKDGVVELVAVMDVHIHGFFFFVQMGDGKGTRLLTVFNGGFTGGKLLHRMVLSVRSDYAPGFSIIQYSLFVQNLQYLHQNLNRPREFNPL